MYTVKPASRTQRAKRATCGLMPGTSGITITAGPVPDTWTILVVSFSVILRGWKSSSGSYSSRFLVAMGSNPLIFDIPISHEILTASLDEVPERDGGEPGRGLSAVTRWVLCWRSVMLCADRWAAAVRLAWPAAEVFAISSRHSSGAM